MDGPLVACAQESGTPQHGVRIARNELVLGVAHPLVDEREDARLDVAARGRMPSGVEVRGVVAVVQGVGGVGPHVADELVAVAQRACDIRVGAHVGVDFGQEELEAKLVLGHRGDARIEWVVVVLVAPGVNVFGRPVHIEPIHPKRIVQIVGDEVHQAVTRRLVEVKVVLVVGVVVPVANTHLDGECVEVFVHVKDGFEGAREVRDGRLVQDLNEVGQIAVIVRGLIRLKLVGTASTGGEFVVVRVVGEVLQGSRPKAFVEVACLAAIAALHKVVVDVLHICIEAIVVAVDVKPNMTRPRSRQAQIA